MQQQHQHNVPAVLNPTAAAPATVQQPTFNNPAAPAAFPMAGELRSEQQTGAVAVPEDIAPSFKESCVCAPLFNKQRGGVGSFVQSPVSFESNKSANRLWLPQKRTPDDELASKHNQLVAEVASLKATLAEVMGSKNVAAKPSQMKPTTSQATNSTVDSDAHQPAERPSKLRVPSPSAVSPQFSQLRQSQASFRSPRTRAARSPRAQKVDKATPDEEIQAFVNYYPDSGLQIRKTGDATYQFGNSRERRVYVRAGGNFVRIGQGSSRWVYFCLNSSQGALLVGDELPCKLNFESSQS